jgi:hypothetical protein
MVGTNKLGVATAGQLIAGVVLNKSFAGVVKGLNLCLCTSMSACIQFFSSSYCNVLTSHRTLLSYPYVSISEEPWTSQYQIDNKKVKANNVSPQESFQYDQDGV